MASIHKDSSGRSPYWYAKFRDTCGRVAVKSTKQTNRGKAMQISLVWERAARKGREGVLTEAQCRKVLNELLESVSEQTLRAPAVDEFLNGWVKGKLNSKAEGTSTRYEGTVKKFLKSLEGRAKLTVAAVSPRDIEKFRDAQLGLGKAGSTVNVDLKTLRNAFNLAFRQGLIPSNPVNAVEFPQEQRNTHDTFTAEEIRSLITAADDEWKTAILLSCYTGCRIGDAVSMTWQNVKLEGDIKTITFIQKKTRGQIPAVPLHPDLEAHLLSIAGDNPNAPLTPTLANMPVGGRNGLSRAFKDLMKKAKVDDGRVENEKGGKGRSFSKRSFHSFRSTFISALANADVAEELRMRLSGHTTRSSHQVYTKLQLRTLADAVAKLPALNGNAEMGN